VSEKEPGWSAVDLRGNDAVALDENLDL
jgi:hypothetical protein